MVIHPSGEYSLQQNSAMVESYGLGGGDITGYGGVLVNVDRVQESLLIDEALSFDFAAGADGLTINFVYQSPFEPGRPWGITVGPSAGAILQGSRSKSINSVEIYRRNYSK